MEGLGTIRWETNPVALPHTCNLLDDEAAPLKNATKLEIWLSTVHCVDSPLNEAEFLARSIAIGECSERWKRTFATAVDVRQFHQQRVVRHAELAKQICAAGLEHQRFIAQDDGLQFLIWQSKDLIDRVA